MSDLVEKLRSWPFESGDPINAETSFALVKKAAAEIETLRLQLASVRSALQKIAYLVDSEAGEPLDDAIAIANRALADEKST